MEYEHSHPNPGMLGCDRDLFARVWARVEPNAGEGCPIEVLPPQPAPPVPAPLPQPPSARDVQGEDSPSPNDVPCLGREGMDHTRFLQEVIRAELHNWRRYQALSARGGSAGRMLAGMSADERRHAKRLSGAYFLISGIRFLPEVPPMQHNKGDFWANIRELFWAEQRAASVYAAAAEETSDPCLAQLYRELSAEEAAHADLLRAMTEKM